MGNRFAKTFQGLLLVVDEMYSFQWWPIAFLTSLFDNLTTQLEKCFKRNRKRLFLFFFNGNMINQDAFVTNIMEFHIRLIFIFNDVIEMSNVCKN